MECFGPLNPCNNEVNVVYRDEMTVTWLCDGSGRDGPSYHDTIGPT
jgi:hypothetical protein